MSSLANIGWHVLYVKSRHEKKVFDRLLESSLDAFLPMVKTIKNWSDRKKTILQPLFPSYVFVNINTSLDFHKALSIDGACAYIRFGSEYAKVKEEEINKVKFLVESDGIENIETNSQLPSVGDIKKIEYGTLSGLECEVLNVNNVNKIIVRIDSLHQSITATLPLSVICE